MVWFTVRDLSGRCGRRRKNPLASVYIHKSGGSDMKDSREESCPI